MDGMFLKNVGKENVFFSHKHKAPASSVACESKLPTWTCAFTEQNLFHQGVVMEKLHRNKNSSVVNSRKPATI